MANPFTEVREAIWTRLAASPAVAAAVTQFIRFDADTPPGQVNDPATLLEASLALQPVEVPAETLQTNTGEGFSRRFMVVIRGAIDRADLEPVEAIEYAVYRALARERVNRLGLAYVGSFRIDGGVYFSSRREGESPRAEDAELHACVAYITVDLEIDQATLEEGD